MMSEQKQKIMKDCDSVTIRYKFRDDYNPVYINGAYGGVNPAGEIVANFYFERFPLPNEEKISFDGTDFKPSDLAFSAIRFVESGVIMTSETATLLANWLLQQAALAKNGKTDTHKTEE